MGGGGGAKQSNSVYKFLMALKSHFFEALNYINNSPPPTTVGDKRNNQYETERSSKVHSTRAPAAPPVVFSFLFKWGKLGVSNLSKFDKSVQLSVNFVLIPLSFSCKKQHIYQSQVATWQLFETGSRAELKMNIRRVFFNYGNVA